MAAKLGVKEETVSRWHKGKVTLKFKKGPRILRYLHLPAETVLTEVPLFLTLRPMGQLAKRTWLKKRVDNMPGPELEKMFPALEKLLRDEDN